MKQRAITLHIEELLLKGFPPHHRERIGLALQQELTRLIAQGGLPPGLAGGRDISRLEGGSFRAAPGERAEATGARVAQTIYGGMNK